VRAHYIISAAAILVLAATACVTAHAGPAAFTSDSGEMTPGEEAQLREAAKRMPKDQVDKLISEMKTSRHEAVLYRTSPAKMRDELMGYATQMLENRSSGHEKKFREARDKLGNRLHWFQNLNTRVAMPDDLGKDLAEIIIETYKYRPEKDHMPITVASEYGSGPKVKAFLIGILRGDEKWKREIVQHGLTHTTFWKGDPEMYAALDELFKRGGNQDTFVLSDMQSLDKERTLTSLMELVETTSDPRIFYQTTSMVSSYNRTDLLERTFKRVSKIPLTGRRSLPGLCNFPPETLLAYIRDAEGEKLGFALDALEETHGALKNGYPLVISKLSSKDLESRRAAIRCIDRMSRKGTWANGQTYEDLKRYVSHERDPDLRKQAGETFAWLKIQVGQ